MIRRPVSVLPMILAVCLAAASLTGCAVAVGGAAMVGGVAAEERGLRGRASDLGVEACVTDKFIQERLKLLTNIGVEVYEGRVLLTGATNDIALADRAVALTWQCNGIQAVLNEIQLVDSNFADFAHDTVITSKLISAITFDKDVLSINYSVETVNRVVYLIGIAQSKQEIDKVVAHASNIEYVTKVVNHVRIKQASIPAA
jgi:osmotically-inducible protein OsmY